MKRAAKIHKKFRNQQPQNTQEENMKTDLTYPQVVAMAKEKGYTLKHNPKAANPYKVGDIGFKYLGAVVEYLQQVAAKETEPVIVKPKKEKVSQTKVEMEQLIHECIEFNRRAPQWTPVLKWLESKGIKADDPSINCPKPTFRNSEGSIVFEWPEDPKITPKAKYRVMLTTMLSIVKNQSPNIEAP